LKNLIKFLEDIVKWEDYYYLYVITMIHIKSIQTFVVELLQMSLLSDSLLHSIVFPSNSS
jgi:hypothetical protein